jgi:hypothetical protein
VTPRSGLMNIRIRIEHPTEIVAQRKTDLVVEGLSRKCVRNSMRRQVALQSSAIEVRDSEGALSGNRKALA